MVSKNSIKQDVVNGYYHVYNRGVGKMEIFRDDQDYNVFLSYLKEGLCPPPTKKELLREIHIQDRVLYVPSRVPKNFFNKIEILCYGLLPNHIHLLIKQVEKGSMKDFIHSLAIRYSMYFNKKHDRVGPLFQGRYKAAFVDNEIYLIYLSKYIHRNLPVFTKDLTNRNSSYSDYLGLNYSKWVNTSIILNNFNKKLSSEFSKSISYDAFVKNENYIDMSEKLILEK